MTDIRVVDDVLPDIDAYRAQALASEFRSISFGPATFHGIAPIFSTALIDWLVQHMPDVDPMTLSFFRQSPAGQQEPNYIHTDCDMGRSSGVFYLTADPIPGDGTTFWRDRQTGAVASDGADALEALAWRDLARWEPYQTVEAKLNRLVVFPSALYHSRALVENYGQGDGARLVQVCFGGPSVSRH